MSKSEIPFTVSTCTECRRRTETYRTPVPDPDDLIAEYCRDCGSVTDQLVSRVRTEEVDLS